MRTASMLAFVVFVSALTAACDEEGSAEPSADEIQDELLSPTQLKYRLLARFRLFYCDPDYYPVARADEQERALERFPAIAADTEKFEAILAHLKLTGRTAFTPQEKLAIYREDKRLAAVTLEVGNFTNRFSLRASEGQSIFAISGGIDVFGKITVREKVLSPGSCPICLSGDALIATADGPVRVRDLAEGALVWSLDAEGNRVLVPVVEVGSVPIPSWHEFVRLQLVDGREVVASAGHPTADGRRLGELEVGDELDGGRVLSVSTVPAHGSATYDLLPASPTGVYWANGVMLGSTLFETIPPVDRVTLSMNGARQR